MTTRGLQRNKNKVIELLEPYLKLGLSINKAKLPAREIIKFTGTIYRKLAEIKMKKLQNQNDKLLSPSPMKGMSFEKFSNFLKKEIISRNITTI